LPERRHMVLAMTHEEPVADSVEIKLRGEDEPTHVEIGEAVDAVARIKGELMEQLRC